ncbi:MAG: hypothetical protein AB1324_03720 [Candidatus Micrarchaeota archaeon]
MQTKSTEAERVPASKSRRNRFVFAGVLAASIAGSCAAAVRNGNVGFEGSCHRPVSGGYGVSAIRLSILKRKVELFCSYSRHPNTVHGENCTYKSKMPTGRKKTAPGGKVWSEFEIEQSVVERNAGSSDVVSRKSTANAYEPE